VEWLSLVFVDIMLHCMCVRLQSWSGCVLTGFVHVCVCVCVCVYVLGYDLGVDVCVCVCGVGVSAKSLVVCLIPHTRKDTQIHTFTDICWTCSNTVVEKPSVSD